MKRALAVLPLLLAIAQALAGTVADGQALIEASLRQHAPPPYVQEELALVISDMRGHYSVRTLQHTRTHDGQRLQVTTPAELRGSTISFRQDATGMLGASPLFGSGFLLADLLEEAPAQHDYQLAGELLIGRQPHHVIAAQARADQGRRRLYLRRDNLFLSSIEFLDSAGQPWRRVSFRDPRPDERGVWRPGMILAEDLRDGRRSLLKVERRIHLPEPIAP